MPGGVSVVDFKTDAVAEEQREVLERAYGPQLEAYEPVVMRTGRDVVSIRLVSAGGGDGHELGIHE